MKNVVIAILALSTITTGYIVATNSLQMSIEGLDGKTLVVRRGDITIPVNATGSIVPYRRIEIKAEASGEVIHIARNAGERVRAGELLVRLDPINEQRNVDRAKLDVEVAAARLEESQLLLRQAETADLSAANAIIEDLTGAMAYAEFRRDKLAALPEHQRANEEMFERETTLQRSQSQLRKAQADLERINLAIPRARQAVRQAEAALASAKNFEDDAALRLTKTDILAPFDGVVAKIEKQVGEVIQGGKTTITGGTVLAIMLDVRRLIVQAEVDEADIGRVLKLAPPWALPGHEDGLHMPEDTATLDALEHTPTIRVESFPDEEFRGVIERIYPEPERRAGVVTYLVDVVISGGDRSKLLSGMRADVTFTSEHAKNVLLCPTEAIRRGPSGGLGVFIPKETTDSDERPYEWIECTFGLDNGNVSEVRAGLSEADVVYTKLPRKVDRDKMKSKKKKT